MAKVFLLVIIIFSDHPSTMYKTPVDGIDNCYTLAAGLAKGGPPPNENVTKFSIGCSFEGKVEDEPT